MAGARELESNVIDAKVGQFYMVPCLRVPFKFCGTEWVPVLGPKHRDAELGADWDHFHIDWRFASDKMLRDCRGISGSPHGNVISNDAGRWNAPHKIIGAPVLKRRKCKRAMPEFPACQEPKWTALEVGQRERCDKLKDGHICPHRGIDLRPFARPDGTAVCPGHGLHWDLKTGLLLARHQKPNVLYTAPKCV